MAYDDGSAVPGGARGSPAGLNIPLFHTMVLSSEGVPSSLATVPSAEKLISKFSEGSHLSAILAAVRSRLP